LQKRPECVRLQADDEAAVVAGCLPMRLDENLA
jgi:hypothetical protein